METRSLIPESVAIGVLLVAMGIGLAIGTLIGAVCLRAAIALYNMVAALNNRMAGSASSASSVPQPAFRKAMWISFSICVAQLLVGLFVGGVTGTGTTPPGTREKEFNYVVQLLSFPISLLIMTAILAAKLPTTFGRAILVTLCDTLIVLLVLGVVVAIAVVVFGVALSLG
jgi:hypothetical protein